MSITIEPIRLQAPATNIVQDYEFAGMGTTQACLVWAAVAGDGSDAAQMKLSLGMWDTSTVRSINLVAEDGIAVASSNATSFEESTNILEMQHDNDVSIDRSATIAAAPGGNGIRLTWAGSDTAIRPWVIVILINGITGAKIGSLTLNDTDNATATETGLGITPKVIFGMASSLNTGDGATASGKFSFGWAYDNGSSFDQCCYGMGISDNSSTSSARSRVMTDADAGSDFGLAFVFSGATPEASAEITNMVSGEFEITTRYIDARTAPGAAEGDLFYLALDFAEDAAVFVSQVPTTDVDWVPLSGASFTPAATIMIPTFTTTINSTRTTGNDLVFYGLYAASVNAEYQLGCSYESEETVTSNASGRTESHLFTQNRNADAPDFVAENPAFTPGTITFDNAETLFSQSSIASFVLGIAFAAPVGINTIIIVPTGPPLS